MVKRVQRLLKVPKKGPQKLFSQVKSAKKKAEPIYISESDSTGSGLSESFAFYKKKQQPCSKLVSQRVSLLDRQVKFYRCSQSNFNQQRMNHFNFSLTFSFLGNGRFMMQRLWIRNIGQKHLKSVSKQLNAFREKLNGKIWQKFNRNISHTSIIESHGWGMGQFSFQYFFYHRQWWDQFCAQTKLPKSSIGNVSSIPVEKSTIFRCVKASLEPSPLSIWVGPSVTLSDFHCVGFSSLSPTRWSLSLVFGFLWWSSGAASR